MTTTAVHLPGASQWAEKPAIFAGLAGAMGLGAHAEVLEHSLRRAAAFSIEALHASSASFSKRLLSRLPQASRLGGPSPVGRSRIGGGPDLPPGFIWPKHKGRPLDFILQINLADLAGCDLPLCLPTSGLFTFFCDQKDQHWGRHPGNRSAYAVYHFPCSRRLRRHAPPSARFALPTGSLVFRSVFVLPSVGSGDYDRLLQRVRAGAGGELDEQSYLRLREAFFQSQGPSPGQPWHLLGGYATCLHDDLPLEAHLVMSGISSTEGTADPGGPATRSRADCEDWQLLLQIDDDPALGPLWAGCGLLSYWARPADLASGDFSQIYLTTQSP